MFLQEIHWYQCNILTSVCPESTGYSMVNCLGVIDGNGNPPVINLKSERVIAYRPEIAQCFDNSPNVAIYFQQLYHWQQFCTRPDGYFYKSAEEMAQETCITAKRQRKCRDMLEQAGWISIKKEMANGHPTLHFKVLVTLATTISPLGEKTNGNSQKDKSITRDDTRKSSVTSETQASIDKIYKAWLVYMVIDPEVRNTTDPEARSAAYVQAKKLTRLTDKRSTKIAARLADAGEPMILKAIKNISESPFHRGDNDREWKASLEWLCNSYEKIEEWATK